MRKLNEVETFLEEKGFQWFSFSPGQSHRNTGVIFYWKPEEFPEHFPKNTSLYPAKFIPTNFTPEHRGYCKDGKRKMELIRLFPNGTWSVAEKADTSVYPYEMKWQGFNFRELEEVRIVSGKPDKSDLEKLL